MLPEGFWMTTLGNVSSSCTTESESSADRSVEVKQTMQQRLLQCGSRLCRRCVLELHNALAWARKWHIPWLSSQPKASVGQNSSSAWFSKLSCSSKSDFKKLRNKTGWFYAKNGTIYVYLSESVDCESPRRATLSDKNTSDETKQNWVVCFFMSCTISGKGTGQGLSADTGRSDGNPGLTFCSLQIADGLLRQGVDLFIVCFRMFGLQHGRAEEITLFKVLFLHQQQTKQLLYIIHPPFIQRETAVCSCPLTQVKMDCIVKSSSLLLP